eukprot:6173390-Pleurochrysis_carterae.AAC.5
MFIADDKGDSILDRRTPVSHERVCVNNSRKRQMVRSEVAPLHLFQGPVRLQRQQQAPPFNATRRVAFKSFASAAKRGMHRRPAAKRTAVVGKHLLGLVRARARRDQRVEGDDVGLDAQRGHLSDERVRGATVRHLGVRREQRVERDQVGHDAREHHLLEHAVRLERLRRARVRGDEGRVRLDVGREPALAHLPHQGVHALGLHRVRVAAEQRVERDGVGARQAVAPVHHPQQGLGRRHVLQ